MHSNRTPRNAQQLRSIIQTMGRSIDEARTRRMGPTAPQAPVAPPARNDPAPKLDHPSALPATTGTPPIRSANEMFAEGGQRLKARPKKAD